MKKIIIVTGVFAAILLLWISPLASGEGQAGLMHTPFLSSNLIGKKVENYNQDDLGSVEDLVIDPDGRIIYVVISHSGIQKKGGKLTPVPFSAIDKKYSGEGKVVVDVRKGEIKNAPGFFDNQWPDFFNSSYGEKLHGYYEQPTKKKEKEEDKRDIFKTLFSVPLPNL